MKNLISFLNFLKQNPSIRIPSLLTGVMYGLFYYASIGYLFIESQSFGIITIPDFSRFIFKTRAPFLWEPTLRIYTGVGLTLDFSVFNTLIVVFLIGVAYLNIALLITSIKMPKICRVGSKSGLAASMVPAFFSGFACCAPTFVILWVGIFGGVATSVLAVLRWGLPLAILLLCLSAWQGISKLDFQ